MEANQQIQRVFGCALPKRESEALYNRLQAREKQLVTDIILKQQIEKELMILCKIQNKNRSMCYELYSEKIGLIDFVLQYNSTNF